MCLESTMIYNLILSYANIHSQLHKPMCHKLRYKEVTHKSLTHNANIPAHTHTHTHTHIYIR